VNIRQEWMTDNQYFGSDYPNNKLLDEAKERFEMQKKSLEGKDALIDGIEERVVTQNHTNPLNQLKYDKKIHCDMTSVIHTGSIVEVEDKIWLVTSKIHSTQAYKTGSLVECNNTLKWQTPTGEIKSYPCIIQDKTSVYSSGIEENKYLSLADDQILIIIQNNADTSQLELDKRFIFDHSKNNIYKLSKIQSLIQEGLLYFTMTKDQEGANDNLELNLADYVVNNYVLTILNGDIASLNISEELQLSVQVINNGASVENPIITYSSDNETVATVDNNGLITCHAIGQAVITATYNGVSDTITINGIEVVTDNYSIEYISPISQIYTGQSKTLNIKVLNNGTEVFDKTVTWSVSDITLATITGSTNTTCTIKANSNKLGNVTLKCSLTDDTNVFKDAVIQVKSIV
jgi:hypothetical protein